MQHFAVDMRVPVSKMWESIEVVIQASLKTAQDSVGGPFPAYSAGKSWDEFPSKTSSGKKFHRNERLFDGTDFSLLLSKAQFEELNESRGEVSL